MTKETFIYGTQTIDFELIYSDRKTLGITVQPDLSVQVKAPKNASRENIFKKIEKRASWIVEQKRYFLSFLPRQEDYLYKSGVARCLPPNWSRKRDRPAFLFRKLTSM